MAVKKLKQARKPRVSAATELKAAQAKYENLVERVENYIRALRNQMPDNFRMDMAVKTADGKDHLMNVASLLASVLTATGLGQQVRLVANPDAKGGTLGVRFYAPLSVQPLEDFIYSNQ